MYTFGCKCLSVRIGYAKRRLVAAGSLIRTIMNLDTTGAHAVWLGAARAAGPHELHLLEEVIAPRPTADGAYD